MSSEFLEPLLPHLLNCLLRVEILWIKFYGFTTGIALNVKLTAAARKVVNEFAV